MGFDAGSAVSPLDFDFTAVGGPTGTVPEPSQAALQQFYNGVVEIFGTISPEGMDKALSAAETVGKAEEINGRLKDLVADLCAGSPSKEVLDQLPGRILQSFVGWLVGELMDPTQALAGMRLSPVAQTNATQG